ncbi:MAG: hypothetical protein HY673_16750 [Chloroflexi bacterium]|nr:hypothetical protein [Chloroflexota bacterium]
MAENDEALTLTVEAASKLLGISRTLGFTLAKQNKFPVPVLRCGRRVLVPRNQLLRLLGEATSSMPAGKECGRV